MIALGRKLRTPQPPNFVPWLKDALGSKAEAYADAGITGRNCAVIAINAIIDGMASLTIRKLPENTKRRLRMRAARNGHSMEQEARELLEAGLAQAEPKSENLGETIHRRFAALGGVDLKIPPRGPIRDPGIR